jgi:hypothetical protein
MGSHYISCVLRLEKYDSSNKKAQEKRGLNRPLKLRNSALDRFVVKYCPTSTQEDHTS